jgi:hypothetical protein
MPEFVVPEASEPFQSAQIYGWIEQLCVHSYNDLLAPHWSAHDRAIPTERFDPVRFTRNRESEADVEARTLDLEPRTIPSRAESAGEARRRMTEAVRSGHYVRVASRQARPPLERVATAHPAVAVVIVDRSEPSDAVPVQTVHLTWIDRIRQMLAKRWSYVVAWLAGSRR